MGRSEGVAAEKAAARERFRAARSRLAAADRADESKAIVRRALALPEVAAGRVVFAFWPLLDRGEVDVRPLLWALVRGGLEVALPAVVPDPAPRLVHRRFEGEDALVPGPWGLREPAQTAPEIPPGAADVVVVPGLAMGRDGSRLGYGGGFYDALLTGTPALRLGVVWAACLTDTLPHEPHDAPLDLVVTGAETVRVRRNPLGPGA